MAAASVGPMSTWTAPRRTDPPYVTDERRGLEAWLEYHRATLLTKCAGLPPEQLAERSCPPSSMSLLGLVRHMADVERNWFRRVLGREDAPYLFYGDDPDDDGAFDRVDPARADDDLRVYEAEVAAARQVAQRHDLDDTGLRRGEDVPLRWIYLHMIEEYARHNGHADLLRERVDGVTGE